MNIYTGICYVLKIDIYIYIYLLLYYKTQSVQACRDGQPHPCYYADAMQKTLTQKEERTALRSKAGTLATRLRLVLGGTNLWMIANADTHTHLAHAFKMNKMI